MTKAPVVVVHRDAQLLAEAGAARLVTRLVDVQSSRGGASVVLTGGTMGSAILAAVASSPARDAIDWSRLDVWWGDERFLPSGDPDRNETQNRAALLDAVPLDPARVHAMPGPDGPDGDDVDAAAASYADALAQAATGGEPTPIFDILMLGMGPDAHVASLFPESPALYERERSVVAVRNSPKPPPTRITLTMPVLRRAEDVWFLVAGADKAQAVGLALSGAGEVQAPAAGPRGRRATLWLVDRAAARSVPRLAGPAQPLNSPGQHHDGILAAMVLTTRVGLADETATAELLQRLGQDGLAVGVAAPLLHVGQVGLVRLVPRRRAGWPGPGRPGSRSAGSPRSRERPGPAPRRSWGGSRDRWCTSTRCGRAGRRRRARPRPSGRRRPGSLGSRCHLPLMNPPGLGRRWISSSKMTLNRCQGGW